MIRLRPIIFACAALAATSAFAWDASGHMVIAAIAWDNMTPHARAVATRLLKIGGTPQTNDFLTAACWADDIRRERRETGPWHYIDIHFRQDGKPDFNQPDAQNVVWAIQRFEQVLNDPKQPVADRADALRFVMHFVGDIHQPLHASSRDSDEMPKGDAGGNRFKIESPFQEAPGRYPIRNLHALWDLGCGLLPDLPRDFRPLTPAGKQEIENLARSLERTDPPSKLHPYRDLSPKTWALESFIAAKTVVYTLPEGSKPTGAYLAKGQNLSGKRVALAGYRLAAVLNQLLK